MRFELKCQYAHTPSPEFFVPCVTRRPFVLKTGVCSLTESPWYQTISCLCLHNLVAHFSCPDWRQELPLQPADAVLFWSTAMGLRYFGGCHWPWAIVRCLLWRCSMVLAWQCCCPFLSFWNIAFHSLEWCWLLVASWHFPRKEGATLNVELRFNALTTNGDRAYAKSRNSYLIFIHVHNCVLCIQLSSNTVKK